MSFYVKITLYSLAAITGMYFLWEYLLKYTVNKNSSNIPCLDGMSKEKANWILEQYKKDQKDYINNLANGSFHKIDKVNANKIPALDTKKDGSGRCEDYDNVEVKALIGAGPSGKSFKELLKELTTGKVAEILSEKDVKDIAWAKCVKQNSSPDEHINWAINEAKNGRRPAEAQKICEFAERAHTKNLWEITRRNLGLDKKGFSLHPWEEWSYQGPYNALKNFSWNEFKFFMQYREDDRYEWIKRIGKAAESKGYDAIGKFPNGECLPVGHKLVPQHEYIKDYPKTDELPDGTEYDVESARWALCIINSKSKEKIKKEEREFFLSGLNNKTPKVSNSVQNEVAETLDEDKYKVLKAEKELKEKGVYDGPYKMLEGSSPIKYETFKEFAINKIKEQYKHWAKYSSPYVISWLEDTAPNTMEELKDAANNSGQSYYQKIRRAVEDNELNSVFNEIAETIFKWMDFQIHKEEYPVDGKTKTGFYINLLEYDDLDVKPEYNKFNTQEENMKDIFGTPLTLPNGSFSRFQEPTWAENWNEIRLSKNLNKEGFKIDE